MSKRKDKLFSEGAKEAVIMKKVGVTGRDILYTYIFWPFPPPPPQCLSKVKNRDEFEGGLEKRKGKGGTRRKKKSDKTHVKIPL